MRGWELRGEGLGSCGMTCRGVACPSRRLQPGLAGGGWRLGLALDTFRNCISLIFCEWASLEEPCTAGMPKRQRPQGLCLQSSKFICVPSPRPDLEPLS